MTCDADVSKRRIGGAVDFFDYFFRRPGLLQFAWRLALCRVRDRLARATAGPQRFADQIWWTLPGRQGAGKIGLLNLRFRQSEAPVTVVRMLLECCSNLPVAPPRTGLPRSRRLLGAGKRGRAAAERTFGPGASFRLDSSASRAPQLPAGRGLYAWISIGLCVISFELVVYFQNLMRFDRHHRDLVLFSFWRWKPAP